MCKFYFQSPKQKRGILKYTPKRLPSYLTISEVMDGIEPPFKVLQTRASPLGHMTLIKCNDNVNILVYEISRLFYLFVDKSCSD